MKTIIQLIALVAISATLIGCANRNSGNQVTLMQKAHKNSQPPAFAGAVNGNEKARQGASGTIVNNFYIGDNASQNAADKKQAVTASAAASQNGNATNTPPPAPAPKPADSATPTPAPPIPNALDAPAPPLALDTSP